MIELEEVRQAILRAAELPDSAAKVDALESLCREALQLNGFLDAFRGQLHLLNACKAVVRPDRMLAAYTALRSNFEQHGHDWPESLAGYMVRAGALVLSFVDSFPEIPRSQLDALFADQEQLHLARGESISVVLEARAWLELDAGNLERARDAYERLRTTPPAESWCAPCRINRQVSMLVRLDDDTAIALAAPLLDGPRKCDTVPSSTWATLLLPLARQGNWERARDYYGRAHRSALSSPQWLGSAAKVITFAAIEGSFVKGKHLLERCLPHAFEPTAKDSIRDFYVAASVFFEALGRERTTITMTTPATFPLHARDGRYDVAALRSWFEDAARQLALAFDRRNGNDFHVKRLATASDVLALRPRAA
ncbi:MAG: hypothetical protein JWP01_947 [Myxococcales bacterium]|nr:hypothetical protein [Myxococcales bacterium]